MVSPAGSDGAVEPGRILPIFWLAGQRNLRDVKYGKAIIYVAFHIELTLWLVGIHVYQPRDHVRGEGHNECLEANKEIMLAVLAK